MIYENEYDECVDLGAADADARRNAMAAVNEEDAGIEVEEWAAEEND
jgi:hypothetical protein